MPSGPQKIKSENPSRLNYLSHLSLWFPTSELFEREKERKSSFMCTIHALSPKNGKQVGCDPSYRTHVPAPTCPIPKIRCNPKSRWRLPETARVKLTLKFQNLPPRWLFYGRLQGNVYGNWKVVTYLSHALVSSQSKLVVQASRGSPVIDGKVSFRLLAWLSVPGTWPMLFPLIGYSSLLPLYLRPLSSSS